MARLLEVSMANKVIEEKRDPPMAGTLMRK
jgi:hypothetical protein